MKAIIRSSDENYMKDGTTYSLRDIKSGDNILTGKVVKWGGKWKSFWWVIDFSELDCSGEYENNSF